MKKQVIIFIALIAFAAIADTASTIIGRTPKDFGPGKIVSIIAENKTASAASLTVKSIVFAGEMAHTNTVVSATVTNTAAFVKSEYILPGSVYYADGVGSTNCIVYVVIER